MCFIQVFSVPPNFVMGSSKRTLIFFYVLLLPVLSLARVIPSEKEDVHNDFLMSIDTSENRDAAIGIDYFDEPNKYFPNAKNTNERSSKGLGNTYPTFYNDETSTISEDPNAGTQQVTVFSVLGMPVVVEQGQTTINVEPVKIDVFEDLIMQEGENTEANIETESYFPVTNTNSHDVTKYYHTNTRYSEPTHIYSNSKGSTPTQTTYSKPFTSHVTTFDNKPVEVDRTSLDFITKELLSQSSTPTGKVKNTMETVSKNEGENIYSTKMMERTTTDPIVSMETITFSPMSFLSTTEKTTKIAEMEDMQTDRNSMMSNKATDGTKIQDLTTMSHTKNQDILSHDVHSNEIKFVATSTDDNAVMEMDPAAGTPPSTEDYSTTKSSDQFMEDKSQTPAEYSKVLNGESTTHIKDILAQLTTPRSMPIVVDKIIYPIKRTMSPQVLADFGLSFNNVLYYIADSMKSFQRIMHCSFGLKNMLPREKRAVSRRGVAVRIANNVENIIISLPADKDQIKQVGVAIPSTLLQSEIEDESCDENKANMKDRFVGNVQISLMQTLRLLHNVDDYLVNSETKNIFNFPDAGLTGYAFGSTKILISKGSDLLVQIDPQMKRVILRPGMITINLNSNFIPAEFTVLSETKLSAVRDLKNVFQSSIQFITMQNAHIQPGGVRDQINSLSTNNPTVSNVAISSSKETYPTKSTTMKTSHPMTTTKTASASDNNLSTSYPPLIHTSTKYATAAPEKDNVQIDNTEGSLAEALNNETYTLEDIRKLISLLQVLQEGDFKETLNDTDKMLLVQTINAETWNEKDSTNNQSPSLPSRVSLYRQRIKGHIDNFRKKIKKQILPASTAASAVEKIKLLENYLMDYDKKNDTNKGTEKENDPTVGSIQSAIAASTEPHDKISQIINVHDSSIQDDLTPQVNSGGYIILEPVQLINQPSNGQNSHITQTGTQTHAATGQSLPSSNNPQSTHPQIQVLHQNIQATPEESLTGLQQSQIVPQQVAQVVNTHGQQSNINQQILQNVANNQNPVAPVQQRPGQQQVSLVTVRLSPLQIAMNILRNSFRRPFGR